MLQAILASVLAAFIAGFVIGGGLAWHHAGTQKLKARIAYLEQQRTAIRNMAGVASKLDAESGEADDANDKIVAEILQDLLTKKPAEPANDNKAVSAPLVCVDADSMRKLGTIR